jgi:hypothetical protein
MGCCGGSRKPEIVIAEHKFAYVVSAFSLSAHFVGGLSEKC